MKNILLLAVTMQQLFLAAKTQKTESIHVKGIDELDKAMDQATPGASSGQWGGRMTPIRFHG